MGRIPERNPGLGGRHYIKIVKKVGGCLVGPRSIVAPTSPDGSFQAPWFTNSLPCSLVGLSKFSSINKASH
ncbi:hypothetical protein QQP08_002896 [Theobroma cacao]|nr:hypothetical protein QQP08_002896 [Theobroma cacao]